MKAFHTRLLWIISFSLVCSAGDKSAEKAISKALDDLNTKIIEEQAQQPVDGANDENNSNNNNAGTASPGHPATPTKSSSPAKEPVSSPIKEPEKAPEESKQGNR